MKKLRLGVIGCGDIAAYTLLMAKLGHNIKIAACSDIDIARAEKYARYFKGAKAFKDYTKMIEEIELDAIYIAVPHYLHYEIMDYALDNNLHILCEKPITTSIEHAEKIIEKAEKKNLKVGVNYQYRYDKKCFTMANAARNNELGALYYARCNIPWHRKESYFTNSKWHADKYKSGGGTLLTQGSHALDILLWAFNEKPVNTLGAVRNFKFKDIETEDSAIGYIELQSGAVISFNSSMANAKEQSITIDIYGEKGSIHYKSGISRLSIKRAKSVKINKYPLPSKGVHALARSLYAFADWVLYDKQYLCTAKDSLLVLSTVLEFYHNATIS